VPIRVRLTLVFLVAMAAVMLATGVFLTLRLRAELENAVDAGLRSRAETLLAALDPADPSLGPVDPLAEEDEAFTQLLATNGTVVESSPILEGRPLLPPTTVRVLSGPAFLERTVPTAEEPVPARILALPAGGGLVVVVASSLEEQREAVAALVGLLAVGGPLALAVATVVVWLLTGWAFRPVERMRTEAEAVSMTEPDRRLTVPSTRDEVAGLAGSLNRMLDRLEEALDRERRFVDDASHELRTPVAALKAELELAMSRSRTKEELESAVRRAATDSEALARLTEDLLVLARADRGRLPVRSAAVDLDEVIDQVERALSHRASEAGVTVERRVDAAPPARVDPIRLRQALSNLLDNAVRHTPPGGRVRLTASRVDGAVVLEVADTGPGFPAETLAHPFEPFARASTVRGREGGAGLGMAIVRAVVEAHGGSVTLDNPDDGGARVRLRFPEA
jgi:two-component system, OmpR family, sensor kinase